MLVGLIGCGRGEKARKVLTWKERTEGDTHRWIAVLKRRMTYHYPFKVTENIRHPFPELAPSFNTKAKHKT